MQTDTTAKLWELIKDIKFGMFTAHHGNGHLHSRPMTTLNRDERSGVLWFFMSKSGEPVLDIESTPEVNISYGNASKDEYVSVSGTARVVNDPAKKEELWNPSYKGWFKGGVNDPDLALVAVTINHAEYWDVTRNTATKIYEMAKAAMTGEEPKLAEHSKVRMK
jgi:general stress protein 26